MKTVTSEQSPHQGSALGFMPRVWGDFLEALQNLRAQKLRSLLPRSVSCSALAA